MKNFYKSWGISFMLFLGALSLSLGGYFLNTTSHRLRSENALEEKILNSLQKIENPEKKRNSLTNPSLTSVPQHLTITAKKHHLVVSQHRNLPGNRTEITFQGDLDTDVFDYLKDLSDHFSSTLSLQEMGLFREGKTLMGKLVFETFPKQVLND